MLQLETDYKGADFHANLKAMNPSILDDTLTGMFIGSYLQSITPRLALGLETIWQRPGGQEGPTAVVSYAARYKADDWIASAQLLPQGGIQASYWRKLAKKVEAGVDISLQFVGLSGAPSSPMMGMKNDGSASIGAKYDFLSSSFKGQIDSNGKVSAWLDKRIAQPVGVTLAAEMDHAKVRFRRRPQAVFEASTKLLLICSFRVPRSSGWPWLSSSPLQKRVWRHRRSWLPPASHRTKPSCHLSDLHSIQTLCIQTSLLLLRRPVPHHLARDDESPFNSYVCIKSYTLHSYPAVVDDVVRPQHTPWTIAGLIYHLRTSLHRRPCAVGAEREGGRSTAWRQASGSPFVYTAAEEERPTRPVQPCVEIPLMNIGLEP